MDAARVPAWQMGRAAYYADFVIVPVLALCFGYVVASRGAIDRFAAAGLFAGYVAWTIAEYAIHRFLFHRWYRREHFAHHARPTAYIGVPPWQTLLAFAAAGAAFVAFGGASFGGSAAVGLLAGYFSYIFVHQRIHHEPRLRHARSLYRRPRAAHELHHRGVEANFGVVHPFWDHVFRTYRAP
jgi:sterol desaturase/sphingolipid hydroxylase (fatty acid hydroxylase superfamily)